MHGAVRIDDEKHCQLIIMIDFIFTSFEDILGHLYHYSYINLIIGVPLPPCYCFGDHDRIVPPFTLLNQPYQYFNILPLQ